MKRSEYAYQVIKKMIISHEISGAIKENELSEQLEISRTPLREAMSKLIAEGWVEEYENRNKFVKPVTLKEIKNIFQIRSDLEVMALNIAWSKIELSTIQEIMADITEACNGKNHQVLNTNDDKIHKYILETTKNDTLINMLTFTNDRLSMIRNNNNVEHAMITAKEHIDLCQNIVSRNKDESIATMKTHIENSYSRIIS